MGNQINFKRYELKYMLSDEQLTEVKAAMQRHMQPDRFFASCVRSLYFDTDNYRLIRHSIEHPAYKEKLRLRSYWRADGNDPVFVELKKKYRSVVYKRRIELPLAEALSWICDGSAPDSACQLTGAEPQIMQEIDYFIHYYRTLAPAALITYDRKAYTGSEQTDLRMTFDSNVRADVQNLTLSKETGSLDLLPEGRTLLEIKTGGGMPLWLTEVLGRCRIYKTTYSKYGTAYQTILYPSRRDENHRKGERRYA